MKIEIMIYAYIAICVSMILYNIIYVFILKHRERALVSNSEKLKEILNEQIEILKKGEEISEKHKSFSAASLIKRRELLLLTRLLKLYLKKSLP